LSTPQALQDFANWVATIRGDEASEAQTYVNRLLQAWGWADAVEAGTTFERRIPKGSLAGGMGKAEALIEATRGTVLVERKSRGRPLQRDFPQLQRYWIYLTPKPAYALLSNFGAPRIIRKFARSLRTRKSRRRGGRAGESYLDH
jgi:hypothetical protein